MRDARNMLSSVTENKSLHIVASCWTFIDIHKRSFVIKDFGKINYFFIPHLITVGLEKRIACVNVYILKVPKICFS